MPLRMPVAFCSPVPISLMSTPYHRLPLVWEAAGMKDSMVGVRLAFRGTMPPRRKPFDVAPYSPRLRRGFRRARPRGALRGADRARPEAAHGADGYGADHHDQRCLPDARSAEAGRYRAGA